MLKSEGTSSVSPSRVILVIALLWIVVSALNLTKAVHIDDTAYLLVARGIVEHPLSPYSGGINWSEGVGPTHTISQPPLLPYLFAAGFSLFGESEFISHLIIAFFSLGVIIAFYKLLLLLRVPNPLFCLPLFILSPAFPASQNLMTDVPTLFFWLMFFVFLFRFLENHRHEALLKAGVFSGLALLTKYISAVLLPIFLIAALTKRKKSLWLALLIPFVLLLLWGLVSYFEYGKFHFFSKIKFREPFDILKRVCDYIVCLGGICPFALLFIPALFKRRRVFYGVLICLLISLYFFPESFIGKGEVSKSLIIYFWLNGIFTFLSTLYFLCRPIREVSFIEFLKSSYFFLFSWFVGVFLFVSLFAPFVAVRHLLPIIPVVVVVVGLVTTTNLSKVFRNSVLIITATLGILIAVSDWTYADVYRKSARQIRNELGLDARIIAFGHWGWQWYAEKEGMIIFDRYLTKIQQGDYLVVPSNIHSQRMIGKKRNNLKEIKKIEIPSTPVNWIRSMGRNPSGGFYFSVRLIGPWRFSSEPLETFTIYQRL